MNNKNTAVITGASSGIGREFASLMAGRGHDLVLVARDEDRLVELGTKLEREHGVRVRIIAADLADNRAADKICEELEKENIQAEILVNNAGFGNHGRFVETGWEKEYKMIQLNVGAVTRLTKLFLKKMIIDKRGYILNIASTGAFRPGPFMSVYCATKAFVLFLSEAVASEVTGTDVSVTALCPGATKTGFEAAAGIEPSKLRRYKKAVSPRLVAEFGYEAMLARKPVAVYGSMNRAVVAAGRFLPRKLVTSVVRKLKEGKNRL